MKICKKCDTPKDLSQFHKDKTSKDGLYRWCKECKKNYDESYRETENVVEYQKVESL
jgi:hypothetical protein